MSDVGACTMTMGLRSKLNYKYTGDYAQLAILPTPTLNPKP